MLKIIVSQASPDYINKLSEKAEAIIKELHGYTLGVALSILEETAARMKNNVKAH